MTDKLKELLDINLDYSSYTIVECREIKAGALALIKRAEDLEEIRQALLQEVDRHREILKRRQDECDQLRADVERLNLLLKDTVKVYEQALASGAAPKESKHD